jgi:two-component system, OmpR family, sensor histidine kinase QseC
MADKRTSLVRTITLRLAITSLAAIALQLCIVVLRTYFIEDDLNRSYVTHQTRALLSELSASPSGLALSKSHFPREYSDTYGRAYAFRILDEGGELIAEHNGSMISQLSPWPSKRSQDLWLVDLEEEKKLYVAGGIRQRIGERSAWIEVATFGDPANRYLSIVAAEVFDDVWLPMLPLVLLTLGVATLSIRRSLVSLVRAANQAETLMPLESSSRIDLSGMPSEAASLAAAINSLLDRLAVQVKSQRMFLARAAHELRTPLSIITLELGGLEDPRLRRLEEDVRGMSATVDRLLTLARLQSVETPLTSPLNMGQIAGEVVEQLQGWAAKMRHSIELKVCEPADLDGDATAIREALRNLVENAVRHTPADTSIHVTAGPGGLVVVEDSGQGLPGERTEELLLPFRKGNPAADGSGLGLAIVKHAIELHRGQIEMGRSRHGGARFVLNFPSSATLATPRDGDEAIVKRRAPPVSVRHATTGV